MLVGVMAIVNLAIDLVTLREGLSLWNRAVPSFVLMFLLSPSFGMAIYSLVNRRKQSSAIFDVAWTMMTIILAIFGARFYLEMAYGR